METKNEIRKKALACRKQLSGYEVAEYSRKISETLLAAEWYGNTAEFLVYAAVQKEVDLDFFIRTALAGGKQLFYPKVSGDNMDFFQTDSPEKLTEGAFHVPEPSGTERRWDPSAAKRTVILVPGVAFHIQGARIGYGKGYYDRYLNRYPELDPIGIAYEMQLFPLWEQEPQDIRMNRIITEKREVITNETGRIM